MTTVLNDEVVVPLQYENTVLPLQGTYTVHPKVNPADEVEPENLQPQVPRRSIRKRRSVIANGYIVFFSKSMSLT